MPTTTAPENIVANFIEPADPNRDYVHWRNFLRQWWVLGPFSFAERAYATDDPARALNDHFIADEALLVPREDEEITGCIWRRYSAVSVMNKWWELTPERVLLRHHHQLRLRSKEPQPEPPSGVHVTMDLFTIEDELMPCWGSPERGIPGEPHCPRWRPISPPNRTAAPSAASGLAITPRIAHGNSRVVPGISRAFPSTIRSVTWRPRYESRKQAIICCGGALTHLAGDGR